MRIGRSTLAGTLFLSALGLAMLPAGGAGAASAAPSQVSVLSGTSAQNGLTIYKYLRSQGFAPMAAAGATTSMGGESGWNPEAWAMDTNGLYSGGIMQWNGANYPAFTGQDRPTGNASADLGRQLPAIVAYLSGAVGNGGQYVAEMAGAATVMDASRIWSDYVERAGISDAHVSYAQAVAGFAKQVDNVTLPAGT
jgi:hypothetical protein